MIKCLIAVIPVLFAREREEVKQEDPKSLLLLPTDDDDDVDDMAANHQPQPPLSGSPSSAAFHHFQPWRNCIKTEKAEAGGEIPPGPGGKVEQLYYSHAVPPEMDPSRLAAHHPSQPSPFYAPAPDFPKPLPVPRSSHDPELDLKLQQCIEEGNAVG